MTTKDAGLGVVRLVAVVMIDESGGDESGCDCGEGGGGRGGCGCGDEGVLVVIVLTLVVVMRK